MTTLRVISTKDVDRGLTQLDMHAMQTTQGSGGAFTTSVAEIYLDEGAALKHGVLQLSDSGSGVHMKTTLVQQVSIS